MLFYARRIGDGLDSLCVFFLSPNYLQQFLSTSNSSTLYYSAGRAIPFILEQSPASEVRFEFVTFEIESSGNTSGHSAGDLSSRKDASDKILSLSDDVFSIHFVTDQFGYIALGSNLAAKMFIPLTKIPFGAMDRRFERGWVTRHGEVGYCELALRWNDKSSFICHM